jgi:hypothetical protein
VLYASVCVTVFTAPWIVRRVGPRAAMVGGAAGYVAYMLALVWIEYAVVLVRVRRGHAGWLS